MDSWLRRHAVFVTALSGALYEVAGDPLRLSSDSAGVRAFILAIREGWEAMDWHAIGSVPLALCAILERRPFPIAAAYWKRLLASPRGEYYFARHARRAATEMSALAGDVLVLLCDDAVPRLRRLYASIDRVAATARQPGRQARPRP